MKTGRFHFAQFAMRLIPLTRGFGTKRSLLRWCGIQVGDSARFASTVRFFCKGPVIVGSGTWIGTDALFIGGEAAVEIGQDCDIGPQVTFVTGSHELVIGGNRAAGAGESRSIRIEDGCWIGARATILGGAGIGACSIIAAGSVVKDEFPPRSLIAGVPGRLVRTLDGEGAPSVESGVSRNGSGGERSSL